MNKVILMGRLTRDPEVRYSSNGDNLAIARYSLAVNRRFKRQGEAEADFIDCVAFGKAAEFAEKYFRKGQMVAVVGRLQIRDWQDKDGNRRRSAEVVIEEQNFAESRASFEGRTGGASAPRQATPAPAPAPAASNQGFYPIDSSIEDDDLPF